MTDHERDIRDAEAAATFPTLLQMFKTLVQGQVDDRRIQADRAAAQDARIDRLSAENSQIAREMRRDAAAVADLREEVGERFDTLERRFEARMTEIASSIRSTSPGVMAAIVAVVVAFIQFAVPTIIDKFTP